MIMCDENIWRYMWFSLLEQLSDLCICLHAIIGMKLIQLFIYLQGNTSYHWIKIIEINSTILFNIQVLIQNDQLFEKVWLIFGFSCSELVL